MTLISVTALSAIAAAAKGLIVTRQDEAALVLDIIGSPDGAAHVEDIRAQLNAALDKLRDAMLAAQAESDARDKAAKDATDDLTRQRAAWDAAHPNG